MRLLDESDMLIDAWKGARIGQIIELVLSGHMAGFVFNGVIVRKAPTDSFDDLYSKYSQALRSNGVEPWRGMVQGDSF